LELFPAIRSIFLGTPPVIELVEMQGGEPKKDAAAIGAKT